MSIRCKLGQHDDISIGFSNSLGIDDSQKLLYSCKNCGRWCWLVADIIGNVGNGKFRLERLTQEQQTKLLTTRDRKIEDFNRRMAEFKRLYK